MQLSSFNQLKYLHTNIQIRIFISVALIIFLTIQPATAAYLLRTSDALKISVVNQPQLATEQSITPDGQLSLPFLGLFRAEGLTLNQLEGKYKVALTPFIQKPQVVIQLKPAPIYVIQHNLKDSTFDVKQASSTTEALALTGAAYAAEIDHGQTLTIETGEHPDWWEKNWFRVISAAAVVTGVYLSLRR